MNTAAHHLEKAGDEREYLCVDGFLRTLLDTQALATALELGIIDALEKAQTLSFAALRAGVSGSEDGLRLLIAMLQANQVVVELDDCIELTARFRTALRYRDLIEAKIDFASIASADIVNHFTALLMEPRVFMARARMFQLFSYGRCAEYTPENYALARRWMRITTALTRYEARFCLRHYDFAVHRRVVDVGGNSGEFVLQLCRAHPQLRATVMDLPLVCEIGREHLSREPEAGRIGFVPGNAMADALPTGADLISFKSILHDWPDAEATQFMARAAEALEPGGTLLIFERGRVEIGAAGLPYSVLPFLTFAHAYRAPAFYVETLERLGFRDISVERLELELPFFLLFARKAAPRP
jgi:SAM-dependent methyltransferase